MLSDPSIEWNPGPTQFSSIAEKSLVHAIKADNKDIARISSHRFFLLTSRDLGIVPRGLDVKIPLAAAHSTPGLQLAISEITA